MVASVLFCIRIYFDKYFDSCPLGLIKNIVNYIDLLKLKYFVNPQEEYGEI
jgi:hypothetical protein